MRTISYNFLGKTERPVVHNSTILQSKTSVNNNQKLHPFVKWISFVLLMVLSFSVKAQMDVTSSGGTSPVTYATLRAAFDAINAGTHTGTIAISVTASTSEPGMDSLVASGIGSASYTSVTIKPAPGVTATISASVSGGANDGAAVIKLRAADNVTIDGSNTVGGTTRDLTIKNTFDAGTTSTASNNTGVIWLAGIGSNGATNNTIKNCIVQGVNRINCPFGIVSSGTGGGNNSISSASLAANSGNTYTNNGVSRASNCIALLGNGTNPFDVGATVSGNNIDSSNAAGILLSNQSGYNVFNNIIDKASNLTSGVGSVIAMSFTNAQLNGNIYNNKVLFVRQNHNLGTTNVSARGISLSSTLTASNVLVYNNFIGNVHIVTGLSGGTGVIGIGILTAGSGYKIYHNTVNISTAPAQNGSFQFSFYTQTTTTAGGVDLRNNIFVNTIPSAALGGVGQNYAFYNSGTLPAIYSTIDNNDYFTNFSALGRYNNATRNTLAEIQAVDGKNTNSIFVAPTFTSATDLHLSLVAGNAAINNGGTSLAAVTTDIDGAPRSSNFPDMGADEIIYIPKISGFSPASACISSTVTINGADLNTPTAVSLAGVAAATFAGGSTSAATATVAGGYTSPVTGTITFTNAFGTATSSSNLTRLAPGTYSSKSLSTGSVGDQILISGTNLSGVTAVTFNGTPDLSFSVTSSVEVVTTVPAGATTGNIILTDACGNAVNAGSFTVVAANPCGTPSAQATNFVQTGISTTTLNGTFSTASGSPSGYVVVYSTTPLSADPQDGIPYTAGGSLGGGTIKQVSASSSVSLTGLTGNTAYFITIYAFNGGGCTGGPKYNIVTPLVYNFITCPSVPTSVLATPVGNNTGNSVNFTWGSPTGGGASSLTFTVEVYTDAAMTIPVSGSPFTTSATSQSVTGLNIATKYWYKIKANNGCSSSYVTGNVTTGCGAGTILPYTENFDGVIAPAVPSCWTIIDNNADGFVWTTAGVNTGVTGQSNPNTLRYSRNTSVTTTAADDWAISPGFKLTGGVSYTMSFGQGAFSNRENLVVQYGTAAAVTGLGTSSNMTSGIELYSGSGLTNQAFVTQASTFTPSSTGVYYFGFHCTSQSSANGAIFLYVDNFRVEVTPPPPTAPSALTFTSIGSSSITVNWTDNSSNEVGFYVYSSTDGVNYSLQNTVGADVTSSTVGNLNANTQYFFKVTSYNYGGENTNGATGTATTADCGGVYTTNTYVGTFVAGQVKNWNLASNWSLGHAPLSCEDVVINANNLDQSSTTICYLYLNANASMHNLTMTGQNSPVTSGMRQALFVYTNGYNMLITGDLTITNDSTGNQANVDDNILLIAGGASGNNVSTITINGNTNIGATGNRVSSLGGASGFANIIFKGDVNLGTNAFLNYGSLVYYIFDKPGAQTLTMTSTQDDGSTTYGLGNLTVGNTNSTSLTLAGSGTSGASAVVGDLLINSGSTLNLPSGQSLNRTAAGGSFTMGANSFLKVSGASGGVGNSNFPSSFATFSLHNTSTVEYNGTAAQTVSSAPVYGNLTANNASGLTLNGNTTVNNALTFSAGKITTGASALTMGLSGTVVGATPSNYVNGNLAKKIGTGTNVKLFEVGDATTYAMADVAFVGGSTNNTGTITVSTTGGAHPNLGTSGIDPAAYVNRYWTIQNAGVTGFTSISPLFNYTAGEIVGAADNSAFKIADSVYGGGWSLFSNTTNAGFPAFPNSTVSSGVSLSTPVTADFIVGNAYIYPTPTVNDPSTTACEGATYVVTGTNFLGVSSVTIGGVAVTSYTVTSSTSMTINVPLGAAPGGVIAVTNSGGTGTSAGTLSVNPQPQTTASPASQTICSGDAISTITVGNSGSLSATYAWTRTGTIAGGTNSTSGNGDITGTLINGVTVPVTATYSVVATAGGCAGTTATATVVVKASPGTVSVSPTSANICQTTALQLTGSYVAATGSSVNNSGTISIGIPDANVAGANTTLVVNNIPTGALITGMDVQFSISHTFIGDLAINLTAPNGKTLNLAFQDGDAGVNYTNTVISSTGTDPLPTTATNDLTGTYAADGVGGVGASGFLSNVSTFAQLYSVTNGNWKLSARDYFSGDVGTITNYRLTIYYTLAPTFSWTPTAGLFTDAGFTAYTGGSNATVYAKNTAGNYVYNAEISFGGCITKSADINIDVDAVPVLTRTNASQTICSGTAIATIALGTNPVVAGADLSWTRDNGDLNSGAVTGIAASGSGDISGTLVNTTTSPVTVTFTITPTGPGATACPGSSLTATVVVNPTPAGTANLLSQNACSGTGISPILFGSTNNVSGTTFSWTRNNGDVTNGPAKGIAASGTSNIGGTLTNTSGTTTVTFHATPVGPSPSFCQGSPFDVAVVVYNPATIYNVSGSGNYCSPTLGLPVSLSGSQSGYSYQLFETGTPTGTPFAGNGSALPLGTLSAGSYTVTGYNAGCTRTMSGSAVITTSPTVAPSVSISVDANNVCASVPVTFTATASGGGSSPTYDFKVNNVSKQVGSSNIFTSFTLKNDDVVTCTLTTSSPCATSLTGNSNFIVMIIKTTPGTPLFTSGDISNCVLGTQTRLIANTWGGVWSSSNPGVATISVTGGSNTAYITAVANGTTTISYTVTNVTAGCGSSAVTPYTVNAITPAVLGGASSMCLNTTTQLTTNTTGGVWSTANTRASVNSTGLVTSTSAGTAFINYKLTNNATGCTATSTKTITVNPLPAVPGVGVSPSISNVNAICTGKTYQFFGIPSGGTWSTTAANTVATLSPTGSLVTIGAGAASLSYTVSTVNGCTNSRTFTGNIVSCFARETEPVVTTKSFDKITVMPNPAKANSIITIDTKGAVQSGHVTISDIRGNVLITKKIVNENDLKMSIGTLSKGTYLVTVTTTTNKKVERLVVE